METRRRTLPWLGLAAVVMAALGLLTTGQTASTAPANGEGSVYIVDISGTIDLGLAPYLDRVIREAERAGAAAVIIVIDTPGGRLDAVIQMRDALIDTPLRTIALVDSTAFSAGALVAIASDEIYMTPGSVMGAATPVDGTTGEVADEKTISAVRATFEAAAEQNGRDPQVAAAMVDDSIEIEGLIAEGRLLTLTVAQAEEFGYADGVVANLDALLVELGLDDRDRVDAGLTLAEQVVRIVTNPLVASLLLIVGLLLLVGDLLSGGVGVGVAVGAALLGLFFWGHMLAGLAGWEDIALVVLGVVLIAVEVFVVPGFGVPGILGLISLAAGTFMAMIYREFDFVTNDDLLRAALTVGISLTLTVIGLIAIVALVARTGPPSGLVLSSRLGVAEPVTRRSQGGWLRWFGDGSSTAADTAPGHTATSSTGTSSTGTSHDRTIATLVGARGVALSDLRPSGVADIDGRRVDVVTSGEYLRRGDRLEVIVDEGWRRVVRLAPPAGPDDPVIDQPQEG
jgi:membrane-bound serine protease (ClpP class)